MRETDPVVKVSVMSGQESGLRWLQREAKAAGESTVEYAQLDGNGVFLIWDSGPDAEGRFPLAERIRIARSYGGLIYQRRIIVVKGWIEVEKLWPTEGRG